MDGARGDETREREETRTRRIRRGRPDHHLVRCGTYCLSIACQVRTVCLRYLPSLETAVHVKLLTLGGKAAVGGPPSATGLGCIAASITHRTFSLLALLLLSTSAQNLEVARGDTVATGLGGQELALLSVACLEPVLALSWT